MKTTFNALYEERRKEVFDKKYDFFSCRLHDGMDHGEYKNWLVTFLLLTKDEKKQLIKLTYNRMKAYNKRYKPKDYVGFVDKHGNELR